MNALGALFGIALVGLAALGFHLVGFTGGALLFAWAAGLLLFALFVRALGYLITRAINYLFVSYR